LYGIRSVSDVFYHIFIIAEIRKNSTGNYIFLFFMQNIFLAGRPCPLERLYKKSLYE